MTGKTGNGMDENLRVALARYAARIVAPLDETPAARLWHVSAAGRPAVLKLWRKGHAGNETAGGALMQAWADSGAMVRVDFVNPDSLLMEPLDGPSLGDLSRAYEDGRACALLAETAHALHRTRPAPIAGMPHLAEWFTALDKLEFDPDCPAPLKADMARATELAHTLLASTTQPVPLHGDLHHDNVIMTLSGPKAFDAKGVLGDLAYEMANALRNPKGVPALSQNPARLDACMTRYAKALSIDRQRLADWGSAKSALSIAWRAQGRLTTDKEANLLSLMLSRASAP